MNFTIVEVTKKKERRIIKASEMKQGQIARIKSATESRYMDKIVMRNLSSEWFELIDLSFPKKSECWTNEDCNIEVELLEPGTRLVLEIGEDNVYEE